MRRHSFRFALVHLALGVNWCCLGFAAESGGAVSAASGAETADAGHAADPGLRDRILRYSADRRALLQKYREPLSPVRAERMQQFYSAHLRDLQALEGGGSIARQVDRRLLKSELQYRLALIERDAARNAAAARLIPGVDLLVGLLEQHERTHGINARKTAETMDRLTQGLQDLPQPIQALRDAAEPTTDDKLAAYRAAEAIGRLRQRIDHLHRFYSGYDPGYSWWCDRPKKDLDAQLIAHEQMLREDIVGVPAEDQETIIGEPIGEQAMQIELAHEMIPYSPAQLVAIAQREFAWCDAQMAKASAELGFGDDWRAAMEAVKQRHVPAGEQPEMIKRLADEAIQYVQNHDVVTVPPLAAEVWRMEMMSPARQRVNPYFLGGDTIIVSYPTDAMSHREKLMSMRGNNEHFARATVHHELIPGHHLQLFMNARYRPDRQAFETPFWIEGWALYWEMLLWDKGFARGPEDRVGMLFWRKHRCARIIFSLSYQLGRMTPEQCVDYLVERVGHERRNATAEVRRSVMGDYSPLYQAAYMLGGLQIRALRAELVDTQQMSEREFHDAILRQGPIPIAMVRALLTGKMEDEWKFNGEIEPRLEGSREVLPSTRE